MGSPALEARQQESDLVISWMLLGLFALGFLTGLRTMTPIAVLCWMTVLGHVPSAAGWMGFVGSWVAVGIFTLAALGELVGDKLPATPSRTQAVGLLARIVFGGLIAAISAHAVRLPVAIGLLTGVLGAVFGTYSGWFARTRCVARLRCPDLPVALVEDLIAVGGSIMVISLVGR